MSDHDLIVAASRVAKQNTHLWDELTAALNRRLDAHLRVCMAADAAQVASTQGRAREVAVLVDLFRECVVNAEKIAAVNAAKSAAKSAAINAVRPKS